MRAQDYIQLSSYVRVREKSLLRREQWERLIEAASLDDALRILQESAYGVLLQKLDDPQDFEQALSRRLSEEYDALRPMMKDPELLSLLTLRYDAHNEKVLLKEHLLGEDLSELLLPLGEFDPDAWRIHLRSPEGRKNLPLHVGKALSAYAESSDPQELEHFSDLHFYQRMAEKAKELSNPLLEDYARLNIDAYNIFTALRARGRGLESAALDELFAPGGHAGLDVLKSQFYSPAPALLDALRSSLPSALLQAAKEAYEKEEKLSALERVFDIHLLQQMEEGARVTYGPEVVFNYLIQLENEVRNLRLILVSKIGKTDPQRIRERIRRHG